MLLKTIILIYGLIIILIYREGNTLNYLSQECNSKSEWGPWRCPGIGTKCTANIATRYKCIGGNCTSDSLCAKLENHTVSNKCWLYIYIYICCIRGSYFFLCVC